MDGVKLDARLERGLGPLTKWEKMKSELYGERGRSIMCQLGSGFMEAAHRNGNQGEKKVWRVTCPGSSPPCICGAICSWILSFLMGYISQLLVAGIFSASR